MPELPDVELFRRRLSGKAFHRRITRVNLRAPKILEGISGTKLKTTLRGNRLLSSRRHGKHLLIRLQRGGWVALHFGMSGALEPFRASADEPKHTRVLIEFAGENRLAYTSVRHGLDELTAEQVKAVFRCVKAVLRTAIQCRAGSAQFVQRLPGRYLIHERRRGG